MEALPKLLYAGNFLELVTSGSWEYARRVNGVSVVCVAALTVQQEILLVEQFRPPVQQNVLELPAGLAGDEPSIAGEALQAAAARELYEETGYEADHWQCLGQYTSSAGLTNEVTTFFVARGARQTGVGGGVDRKEIKVHKIPLNVAADWLIERVKSGMLLDAKVWAGLLFLANSFPHFPPEP